MGEATGETDIFWPRRAGNGHGLFADFTRSEEHTSELGSSAPGPPTARTTSSDLKVYFALAEQTTKSTDAMTLLTKRSKKGKTALQMTEENELEH